MKKLIEHVAYHLALAERTKERWPNKDDMIWANEHTSEFVPRAEVAVRAIGQFFTQAPLDE